MNKSYLTPKVAIHKKATREGRFSFWLTRLYWCCKYFDKSSFFFSSDFHKPKRQSFFIYTELTAFADMVVLITKRKDSRNKQQVMEQKEGMREWPKKIIVSMTALPKKHFVAMQSTSDLQNLKGGFGKWKLLYIRWKW